MLMIVKEKRLDFMDRILNRSLRLMIKMTNNDMQIGFLPFPGQEDHEDFFLGRRLPEELGICSALRQSSARPRRGVLRRHLESGPQQRTSKDGRANPHHSGRPRHRSLAFLHHLLVHQRSLGRVRPRSLLQSHFRQFYRSVIICCTICITVQLRMDPRVTKTPLQRI